ncbi:unnamed protein product [Spirodela intermedia]|uniref:PHD-type zinc finger plants domain-containing protein n=2 Tax=Spirodela intermedia TaxID=51605 RepID=A0A7I8IEV4_SPIIN|nr:unnamed protein product [Spirodela intermedia]CAA6656151.1 unnamed protein product [Spirodela intermedia]CAA7391613.1 unnamed protein product [Spirodela intermedia]
MMDLNKVCCMCGDIGFPDKLFQCARCFSRFQHSYCANYYEDGSPVAAGLCDWCRSDESKARRRQVRAHQAESPGGALGKHTGGGDRQGAGCGGGNSTSGGEAPARPSARRYKLLKDVLR